MFDCLLIPHISRGITEYYLGHLAMSDSDIKLAGNQIYNGLVV